jgi:hypothetical protein
LIAYQFTIDDPRQCIVSSDAVPVHFAYCFGLLAWSLAGRTDVESLRYYRPGASELSDDGQTLSGSFGSRLLGASEASDQLASIIERLRHDPASRRTFAAILRAEDNLNPGREYPCASGLQLFLRDGALSLLTIMRAQQALTVLPYDAFLFMSLQLFLTAALRAEVGAYVHFAGTFHVYESEISIINELLRGDVISAVLPLPEGDGSEARARLIDLEARLREAASSNDRVTIAQVARTREVDPLVDLARAALCTFAIRKVGGQDFVLPSAGGDGALLLIQKEHC